MAISLTQSPGQWLHLSSQNGVTRRRTGSRKPMLVHSFGEPIHVAFTMSSWQRRLFGVDMENFRRRRLAAAKKDEKQETVTSESREVGDENAGKKSEQTKGFVDKVEEEMGRQFGGVLWFTILLVCLAVFGGSYVYYIVNFASFDDIPILRGPAR